MCSCILWACWAITTCLLVSFELWQAANDRKCRKEGMCVLVPFWKTRLGDLQASNDCVSVTHVWLRLASIMVETGIFAAGVGRRTEVVLLGAHAHETRCSNIGAKSEGMESQLHSCTRACSNGKPQCISSASLGPMWSCCPMRAVRCGAYPGPRKAAVG